MPPNVEENVLSSLELVLPRAVVETCYILKPGVGADFLSRSIDRGTATKIKLFRNRDLSVKLNVKVCRDTSASSLSEPMHIKIEDVLPKDQHASLSLAEENKDGEQEEGSKDLKKLATEPAELHQDESDEPQQELLGSGLISSDILSSDSHRRINGFEHSQDSQSSLLEYESPLQIDLPSSPECDEGNSLHQEATTAAKQVEPTDALYLPVEDDIKSECNSVTYSSAMFVSPKALQEEESDIKDANGLVTKTMDFPQPSEISNDLPSTKTAMHILQIVEVGGETKHSEKCSVPSSEKTDFSGFAKEFEQYASSQHTRKIEVDTSSVEKLSVTTRSKICTKRTFSYPHEKGIYCPLCESKLKSNRNLHNHLKTRHSCDADFQKYYSKVSEELKVKCEVCSKTFCNPHTLATHMDLVHGNHPAAKCDKCGLTLKSMKHLQLHVKRAHTEDGSVFLCHLCPLSFRRKSYLTGHIHNVHASHQGKHRCDCGKEFGSLKYLQTHKARVHSNKRHACLHCGKDFKLYANMLRHVTLVHEKNGHRPYKCSECGKRFGMRSNLKEHFETMHLRKYAFNCGICDAGFRRQKQLEIHVGSMHYTENGTNLDDLTPEPPESVCKTKIDKYSCEHCCARYKQKKQLDQHVRTAHLTNSRTLLPKGYTDIVKSEPGLDSGVCTILMKDFGKSPEFSGVRQLNVLAGGEQNILSDPTFVTKLMEIDEHNIMIANSEGKPSSDGSFILITPEMLQGLDIHTTVKDEQKE